MATTNHASVELAKSATLSGTDHDSFTIQGSRFAQSLGVIYNHGTTTVWATFQFGVPHAAVATPTVAGDNCVPIPAGGSIAVAGRSGVPFVAKVKGDGNLITVALLPTIGLAH